jgi:radical SAM superfamily enzyme YgiQ (UPF0313 family)
LNILILSVFNDYTRRGRKNFGVLQPGIGPLIAGLLPKSKGVSIDIVNEQVKSVDWKKRYDLTFLSFLHSDTDRAFKLSRVLREKGTKTLAGGIFTSTFPELCQPHFDSVAIGEAEGCVPEIFSDFCSGNLKVIYKSKAYDLDSVPTPRFDLVSDNRFPIFVEASKGCPHKCEFCSLASLKMGYRTRNSEKIIEDIRKGQEMIKNAGFLDYKRKVIGFYDNNIGGDLSFLLNLAAYLKKIDVIWGASISLDCLNRSLVRELSLSGCRILFVGLETFNENFASKLGKLKSQFRNSAEIIDVCLKNGISLHSGFMVNPMADEIKDILRIPAEILASGLIQPAFISFATPLPGTRFFNDAASKMAFLPNVLLEDLNGYSLVIQPKEETVKEYATAYRKIARDVYSLKRTIRKATSDFRKLYQGGARDISVLQVFRNPMRNNFDPSGNYIPGQKRVIGYPIPSDNFPLEEEAPLRITDENGKVLPIWKT